MAEATQNSSCTLPDLQVMEYSDHSEVWLLICTGNNFQNHAFYNISKDKFVKSNVPDFRNKKISPTSYPGWLALMDARGSRLDCCLLNTTTREKVQLPSICMESQSESNCFYRCYLSKPPTDPNCHVMFFSISTDDPPLLYCQPGDGKFIIGAKDISDCPFRTSTNFEGKIYAWMFDSEKIVEVDFVEGGIAFNELVNSAGEPLMIPLPSPWGFSTSYMVDCCGELLVVCRICYRYTRETAYFRIFKINVSDKEVSELWSIGDRIIFLGPQYNTSMLCKLGESRLKRNSIYYICEDKYLNVYDIEDRSKTLIKVCPMKRRRNCMMSWIMM